MNEEEKLQLAFKIQQAFSSFQKEINIETILNEFTNLQRLGVTNQFMTLHIENENFLIRINGKLWPPYTRQSETEGLEILNKFGIEHNVLVNGDGFQICMPLPENMQLSRIIQENNPKVIQNALVLTAQEIAKYHNLALEQFSATYPLEKMINDVRKGLINKFDLENFNPDAHAPETVEAIDALQFLIRQCVKIPMVLQKCIADKTFSQNDTIASSVYVDIDNQKAVLVDWEYAALGHWSNDLAILSTDLETEEQKSILADAYHYVRTGIEEPMPAQQQFELRINTLAYGFLTMGWSIRQDNLLRFKPTITALIEQLEVVSSQINLHTMPTTGFFKPPSNKEQPYVPTRREESSPSVLLGNSNQ